MKKKYVDNLQAKCDRTPSVGSIYDCFFRRFFLIHNNFNRIVGKGTHEPTINHVNKSISNHHDWLRWYYHGPWFMEMFAEHYEQQINCVWLVWMKTKPRAIFSILNSRLAGRASKRKKNRMRILIKLVYSLRNFMNNNNAIIVIQNFFRITQRNCTSNMAKTFPM